jgi:hypothetical protein
VRRRTLARRPYDCGAADLAEGHLGMQWALDIVLSLESALGCAHATKWCRAVLSLAELDILEQFG